MTAGQLTSAKNPLLKEVRRAIAKNSLTSDGLCIAETFHLLEEALRSDCELPIIIASETALAAVEKQTASRKQIAVVCVPDALYNEISATESSQGVMALVRPPAWNLEQLFVGAPFLIVMDGLQDPGNAGAILRAAEAFGATGAIFLKGSVSPYNPKAIRASAGSIFRLPVVTGVDEDAVCAMLDRHGIPAFAAMPDGERLLPDVDLTGNCAIVIGAEGRGVGPRLRSAAKGLRIPTTQVESLNAAMAASILLYEARRQRQIKQ